MPTNSKKQAGFTLIEVMVAMLILSIAMTAIHYGQAQGIRAQARIQNVTLATMMAREMKTKLLNRPREELPRAGESDEGFFEPPYDFLHWLLRVEENELAPEYILDYHLTISWADPADKGSSKRSSPSAEATAGKRLESCWLMIKF